MVSRAVEPACGTAQSSSTSDLGRQLRLPMVDEARVAVQQMLDGIEPSIGLKRRAKQRAWGNGMRPSPTVHRVYKADARTMPGMGDQDAHLVVTSPPYFNLVEYETEVGDRQLGNWGDYQTFLDALDEVWRKCFERLVLGGRMCVVVGDVCVARRKGGRHHVIPLHADISVRCRKIGFDYLTPVIWSKIANASTEVGGSNRFLGKPSEPNGIIKNDIEYILMFRKPGKYRKPSPVQRVLSVLDDQDHDLGYRSFWTDIKGEQRKDGHPAPFPVELAERLITLFSFVGDTVLDPFWGRGSTTVAAIRAWRSSIGYEIEPRFVDLGRKRIEGMKSDVPFDLQVTVG